MVRERTGYDQRRVRAWGASRRVCFTMFVRNPMRHVLTRCFRFNFLLRKRSPSLFLRLITTRICSQIVARTNKYLELACFILADEPGPKGVCISSLKSSEMKRLRTALTYTCIIPPILSEHDQGLGHIRCSVLIFALTSIYYMRALLYSPHVPCSIGFSRFLSACCVMGCRQ